MLPSFLPCFVRSFVPLARCAVSACTKHSSELAGLLSSPGARCEQPAAAGMLLQSDVILCRFYTIIPVPDIVLARVVCFNVYSSLIFLFIFFPNGLKFDLCLSFCFWAFLLESSEISVLTSVQGYCSSSCTFQLG